MLFPNGHSFSLHKNIPNRIKACVFSCKMMAKLSRWVLGNPASQSMNTQWKCFHSTIMQIDQPSQLFLQISSDKIEINA